MSAMSDAVATGRHPWLAQFEDAPEAAFGDLLAGYADIHPYERADAPDAARMLFGPLDQDDRARKLLGPAILSWLEKRRKQQLPAARPKLQRQVREISEAFEIVGLLDVTDAAVGLRRRFILWNEWTARLVLSPARDARATFWRTLALTQKLVSEAAPQLDADGLAPMWQRICREAGARLPRHYLSIGLLGLRRLPKRDNASELPWIAGLAQWAIAQRPADAEFKAEWFGLKPLYPRAPERWRKLVANLLSAPTFKDAGIEAPAWWHVDPDFAPMVQGRYTISDAPLRSPMPKDCDRVISELDDPFERVEPLIDRLIQGHRRYLHATGHSYYFVRAIHALGQALIEKCGDAIHVRARKAQLLAREGLKWEPYDCHLWGLWRDALVAEDMPEAAELVGWECVRRDPANVDARNQLATLLANSLGKLDEAETLLRETIEKFPDDAVARSELAELLIFEDRIAEAASFLDAAFDSGFSEATFSARARIYSYENRPDDARRIIETGLKLDPYSVVLNGFVQRLSEGKKLPLKSGAFRTAPDRGEFRSAAVSAAHPEIVEVTRLGTMRRLRFTLEFAPKYEREIALQELRQDSVGRSHFRLC